MEATAASTRIAIKRILFLTDFSEPSESALSYAMALAREHHAEVHALHVLLPEPMNYTSPETTVAAIDAQEEAAQAEMQRTESMLAGVVYSASVVRSADMWPPIERAVEDWGPDLIVLGTHGRTGAKKALLGSVAEMVFRRSPVPVLTVGPFAREGMHGAARFHKVLHATDFSPAAMAAAAYAVSLAQESQAQLVLLHVLAHDPDSSKVARGQRSVAQAMHELFELAPPEVGFWCKPEPVVQYGHPADRILEEATGRHADLIVLGVHESGGYPGVAMHLQRSIAYRVIANARCSVLTVRATN